MGECGIFYHFGQRQQWEARTPMNNTNIGTQNESRVAGVLSGRDRLMFRAFCPMLACSDLMLLFTM